jgi:hypothetical protein
MASANQYKNLDMAYHSRVTAEVFGGEDTRKPSVHPGNLLTVAPGR